MFLALHTILKVGLAGAALSGLAACVSLTPPPAAPVKPVALTPTEQFGIKVTSAPERVALAVHPSGLSANQQAALSGFVTRWRDDGGGLVTVSMPVRPGPQPVALSGAADRVARTAAAFVQSLGVPGEQVRLASYVPGPGAEPAVLVAYARFHAIGPDCAGGWDNVTNTGNNVPFAHFGCAVTANIAAQVADPRDFLAPAVETPADDNRREYVLGKYRQGLITSSAKDDQANGKVSDATSQ